LKHVGLHPLGGFLGWGNFGLKLRVTAEGVETEEQAERLRELGCDEVQGFWFARPLSFTALRNLLTPLGHEAAAATGEMTLRAGVRGRRDIPVKWLERACVLLHGAGHCAGARLRKQSTR
jgi:EAL domain